MKRATFEDVQLQRSPENALGRAIGGLVDIHRPMGSWTGLPSSIGAPASGLLIGAGLGGLYGLGRMAWDRLGGVQRPPRPWWRSPLVIGGAGGLSLGLLSALAQAKDAARDREAASYAATPEYPAPDVAELGVPGGWKMAAFMSAQEKNQVKRVIANDPNIAYFEKQRLLGLVDQADSSQLKRLAALALGGALTAGVAHTVLGTGVFGSTAAGAAGSFFLSNLIP